MHWRIQTTRTISQVIMQQILVKFHHSVINPTYCRFFSLSAIFQEPDNSTFGKPNELEFHTPSCVKGVMFALPSSNSKRTDRFDSYPDKNSVESIQGLLENLRNSSKDEVDRILSRYNSTLDKDEILSVITRNASDWKLAYVFFEWVCRTNQDNQDSIGSTVYNAVLDVLGKMHRFLEVRQVFDEMSKRKGLVDEDTYRVLVNRYAAAHKVDEAIEVFYKREEFGLRKDSSSFRILLIWLCRYKHVEAAETLFYSKKDEFGVDIGMLNVILNGWCVLNDVREAKRFWKDIIASKCAPDKFTYGTFIKALTKKGKLGSALKLFRAMWDKGCNPDVVICNCIIDALCFKKRIPEALEVFKEMKERGCPPNASTYNSLIKYMCKIRRMDKVDELMNEMEFNVGSCLPNAMTYTYLLKSSKKPEEVPRILEKMEINGLEMTADLYNLILKLYMEWGCEESVRHTWKDMERNGMGPDRRSFTIMIHGLGRRGRSEDALRYFNEMLSRGIVPEPITQKLVNTIYLDKRWKGR